MVGEFQLITAVIKLLIAALNAVTIVLKGRKRKGPSPMRPEKETKQPRE